MLCNVFMYPIKSNTHFQYNLNLYIFTDFNPALFIPIIAGLFISFGQSTKSPLTFFSASAGAVGTDKALALTLAASGAAAAFIRFCLLLLKYSWSRRSSSACYFSAAGKVKRKIKGRENNHYYYNFNFLLKLLIRIPENQKGEGLIQDQPPSITRH